ncbi:uncharacterized protein EI90DRAFT_2913029, partial [Cantharellus anzutake]|uniref:uncharacterized protein n=1 Tax=Cantharellus anzutake TaxID=1750568 RepID=UPI001908FBB9
IWKEINDGVWDVIGMGPEMIQSRPMAALLCNAEFTRKLGFIFVDEVHLVLQWGSTFCKDYLKLGELRSRVQTRITFLAMSASLHESAEGENEGRSVGRFKRDHHQCYKNGAGGAHFRPFKAQERGKVGEWGSYGYTDVITGSLTLVVTDVSTAGFWLFIDWFNLITIQIM